MASIKSKLRDKVKHSATGRLKAVGQAKKGGGGGKGTWGRPGEEYKYEDDNAFLDGEDPNYDASECDGFYFSSAPDAKDNTEFKASIKILNEFKKAIRKASREFFLSFDEEEFVRSIQETRVSTLLYHEIVKETIRLSLDQTEKIQQKVAALHRYLVKEKVIDSRHVYKGFYHLFNQVDEITIDVPKAKDAMLYALEGALAFGLTQPEIENLKKILNLGNDQKILKASKVYLRTLVKEYMDSEDLLEAEQCFQELKNPHLGYELTKSAVSVSMDRGARERELVSVLLCSLAGRAVSRDEIAKGFEVLLQRVEDLLMDVPRVLEYLSAFIARAVADEAVPPSFLSQAHIHESDGGFKVIQHAQTLLKKRGAMKRLDRVWGPHSGDSVQTLKNSVKDLVLELFSSGEINEAVTCVKEIPQHYHHEIVKRAFVLALDRNERERKLCAELLIAVGEKKLTLKAQMEQGLGRIEESLNDMVLDHGNAKVIYGKFKKKLVAKLGLADKVVPEGKKDNKKGKTKQ